MSDLPDKNNRFLRLGRFGLSGMDGMYTSWLERIKSDLAGTAEPGCPYKTPESLPGSFGPHVPESNSGTDSEQIAPLIHLQGEVAAVGRPFGTQS